MMLYIVDCYKDETVIHRVNYDDGEYLRPLKFRGYFDDQITDMFKSMYKDVCTKIIFDKNGVGMGMYDRFVWRTEHPSSSLSVDDFGNVKYNYGR